MKPKEELKSILSISNIFRQPSMPSSQGQDYSSCSPAKRMQLKNKNNLSPITDRKEIRKQYFPSHRDQEITEKPSNILDADLKKKLKLLPKLYYNQSTNNLYQTVTEIFPPDHKIWKDLLDKSQTIEQIIDQNPDYFIRLISLYVQQTKLQSFREKIQQQTVISQYTKDFQTGKLKDQDVSLNQSKAHDQFWGLNQQQLYKESLYNSQYTQFKQTQTKPEICKPEFNPNQNSSAHLSTYNSFYLNFKPQYQGKITHYSPFNEQLQLPFISKSSYSKAYQNVKSERAPIQKYHKLGPFAENPEQLVKESTSYYYQKQRMDQMSDSQEVEMSCKSPRMLHPNGPQLVNASFEGQYTSQFNKSYTRNSDQESSFVNKFYESNSVKEILDKKQIRKIY